MYIFLLFTGVALVALGTVIRNREREKEDAEILQPHENIHKEREDHTDLHKRLQALENLVYGLEAEDMDQEEEEEPREPHEQASFQKVLQRELESDPEEDVQPTEMDQGYDLTQERRKLIEGLERGQYSMDMVCSILGMEKGEVLLLRNIYKNYQK